MASPEQAWHDRLLAATEETLSDLKALDDPRLMGMIGDVERLRDRLHAQTQADLPREPSDQESLPE